jgi:hypothetical protein
VSMAEIIKLAKYQRSRNKAVKKTTKLLRSQKREKGHKWPCDLRIVRRAGRTYATSLSVVEASSRQRRQATA